MKNDMTPVSDLEINLGKKISNASFPPSTAAKRFACSLASGMDSLSPRGRRFMAYIAHRFRRQYVLAHEELEWISQWITYEQWSEPVSDVDEDALKTENDSEQLTISEVYGNMEIK